MDRREMIAMVGAASTLSFAGFFDRDDLRSDVGEGTSAEPKRNANTAASPDDFEFPEYATRKRVDAAELATAHIETIRAAGSGMVTQTTTHERNGSTNETTIEFQLTTDGILTSRSRGKFDKTLWTGLDDDRGFVRRETAFGSTYQLTTDTPRIADVCRKRQLSSFAEGVAFGEMRGIVEIDGTLAAHYGVDAVADAATFERLLPGRDIEIEAVSGSLFVTDTGLVKRFTYGADYLERGTSHSHTVEVIFRNVGASVAGPPSWLETARREGRAFQPTVTDDGFLRLELTNGASIPAGAEITISAGGAIREHTLSTEFTVGDRVVVADTGSALSIGIDERPASTSEFGDPQGLFSVTNDGVLLYRTTL